MIVNQNSKNFKYFLTIKRIRQSIRMENLNKQPLKRLEEAVQSVDSGSAVDHPAHYNEHPSGIECITITEHMNFCLGNAMKYLWSTDHKGGIEDLEKAIWYIRREIERRKNND